jgi:hypothetical protein
MNISKIIPHVVLLIGVTARCFSLFGFTSA